MKRIINWTQIKELPAPPGYKENIGVSNMLCGMLEDKIILGGGANFPIHPLDGGSRTEHNYLYLIKAIDNTFKIIDSTMLEKPVADGKAVVFNNIMFYVGGNRILKINVINNKLHISEYFELPFEIKNCIAHQFEGTIYYGLGSIDGKVTNRMFSFNIYTKENIELTPFPATERTQPISEIFYDDIVVFSGGNSIAYTDGYKFNVRKKMWHTVSDVEINDKKISLLGAATTKINSEEMLVIGGFDAEIWKNAVHKLSTLEGEDKQKFREFYFKQDYSYYNWNKEMLIYNYIKDEWKSIGEISFKAPCSHALINNGLNIYSIMGEIRPGERTPDIHRISLQQINEILNN